MLRSSFYSGTHNLTGNALYKLGVAEFKKNSIVNVSALYVSEADSYKIEFDFRQGEYDQNVESGLLYVNDIIFESDNANIPFVFQPMFVDIPNYPQMSGLQRGFVIMNGNVPDIERIDFSAPQEGPRWFNQATSMFSVRQRSTKSGHEISAMIYKIPDEYPEFYCVDVKKSTGCSGHEFVYVDELPYLVERIHDTANELRLKINTDLNSTQNLSLSVYAPRSVRLYSDTPRTVFLSDDSLMNANLTNVTVTFTAPEVSVENVNLTNVQILSIISGIRATIGVSCTPGEYTHPPISRMKSSM